MTITVTDAKEAKRPKLFISYSWTSTPHVDWVMQLATDLRSNGVEAIIDQWHLKEGQDAHAFMEQMVRDEKVSKVVLICDEKYVQRANKREGGVGVESQIITKNIYGDIAQTKFVALTLSNEENGDALLPSFLTSRIYIDFRNSDGYAENLTKLLRWVFDKPLHALPEVGEPPKFLDDQIEFQPIAWAKPRLPKLKEVGDGGEFISIWREAIEKHADFTLDLSGADDGDQKVVDAIESLPPFISSLVVCVRDECERGDLVDVELDKLVQYFEKMLSNYNNGSTNWSADVNKFIAEFLYVAIVAIFLRTRRFVTLEKFLSSPVLAMEHGGVTARSISVSRINTEIRSLEFRNQRLKLNRVSLYADYVKEICGKIPLEFWEYLQGDFYLFLYHDRSSEDGRWWPDSNIYATDRDGSFPLFVKATQSEIRSGLLSPLGLNSREALEALHSEISKGNFKQVRWRSAFSELPIWRLGNFQEILKTFD